ncbi:MAG: glycosyltransferase [Thermoanaerobaculum sp.]|nr:glycosyltransferase [Thermoanaerobaculum sp.]
MATPPVPQELNRFPPALREQVLWVASRGQERQGLIYFPPSIGWHIAAFQRPHHLARAFATLGFAVVFDVSNAADPVYGFLEVEPDIFLFKGPAELLCHLPVTLVWAFTYNLHWRIRVSPQAPLVYDVIDAPEVFPYPQELLQRNHRWALAFADYITCVSRGLLPELQTHRPDAIYLPNACEAFRFDPCGVVHPQQEHWRKLLEGKKPLALYVGSLARWFDFPLVEEVVAKAKEWHVALAGPVLDQTWPWERLWQHPRVTYLGMVRYASLPFLLPLADVGLIPFAGEQVLRGLSPLKMYEFLAAGKPVVATPFPEGQGVPGVFTANDSDGFINAFKRAKSLPKEEFQSLKRFAEKNSWLSRGRNAVKLFGRIGG